MFVPFVIYSARSIWGVFSWLFATSRRAERLANSYLIYMLFPYVVLPSSTLRLVWEVYSSCLP